MIVAKREKLKHYTVATYYLPSGEKRHLFELPWRDNEIGKSCIPDGTYIVDRDHTGRHQYYRLRNEEVAPRSDIEIHMASKLSNLQGCIAPCMKVIGGKDSKNPTAIGAKEAIQELIDLFGENSWALKLES